MYKKYTTPLPYCGMRGSRNTSWDGTANKKTLKPMLISQLQIFETIQGGQGMVQASFATTYGRENYFKSVTKMSSKALLSINDGIWIQHKTFLQSDNNTLLRNRSSFVQQLFVHESKLSFCMKALNHKFLRFKQKISQ